MDDTDKFYPVKDPRELATILKDRLPVSCMVSCLLTWTPIQSWILQGLMKFNCLLGSQSSYEIQGL